MTSTTHAGDQYGFEGLAVSLLHSCPLPRVAIGEDVAASLSSVRDTQ
jgi:hypothetical protein